MNSSVPLTLSQNRENLSQKKNSPPRLFLMFSQKDSLFAVDLPTVKEVLDLAEQWITPVPNTPPFLLGLTNLRGEILAVANFAVLIGTLDTESQRLSHDEERRILVVEAPDPQDVNLPPIRMGLAVSCVEGVVSLNPDQIVSAVDVSEELAPFLRGLYNHDERLLMILDVEAIAQSKRW